MTCWKRGFLPCCPNSLLQQYQWQQNYIKGHVCLYVCAFGELMKKRLSHSRKKRRRDIAGIDLRNIEVEDNLNDFPQDRKEWFYLYKEGLEETGAQRQQSIWLANERCSHHNTLVHKEDLILQNDTAVYACKCTYAYWLCLSKLYNNINSSWQVWKCLHSLK